jgi:tRNA pseudouridine38-40 synthase
MDQTGSIQSAQSNATNDKSSGKQDVSDRGNGQPMKSEHGSNRGRTQSQKRKNDYESNNNSRKKKFGRNWDAVRRREKNVDSRPELEEGVEKEERKPKKKVACFIGYSGEGYHGMQ